MKANKAQSEFKTVTIPADVFEAMAKACAAVANHDGDACWQQDWFPLRDKAQLAINIAARRGIALGCKVRPLFG